MTTRSKRLGRWALRPTTLVIFVLLAGVFGQSYRGRKDVIDSQRHDCERGIRKELLNIHEDDLHIAANEAIMVDPTVPRAAREARKHEALEEEAIVAERYSFVDPKNGGPLVCSKVYPSANPLPF